MLYNPQWRKRDVGDLIAWLETQDPDTGYNFRKCGDCLIARWMGSAIDHSWPPLIQQIYTGQDPARIAVGPKDSSAVFSDPAEWTYGKALARARAAVAAEAA